MRPARVAAAIAAPVVAGLALLAGTAAAAEPWWPSTYGGRVYWSAREAAGLAERDAAAQAERTVLAHDPGRAFAAAGDTLGAWTARAADEAVPAVALREYARACLAHGDSARADSVLGAPRLSASPWAWDALRLRSDLALLAGDPARADSLLRAAAVSAWGDGDRAAWTLRRARVAAARGDAEQATELARLALRLFPSLGPAGGALALLDSTARARGDSLSVADERAGAESEALRGGRNAAVRRLRHLRPRVPEAERWQVALRLAEVLRSARQPLAARAAAESAAALAPPGEPRRRADLERARDLRDAGLVDSALAAYDRLGTPTAWWEAGREAEDAGRWEVAAAAFARVAASPDRRADDARLRAGLALWNRGDADSARAWWRRSPSEGARFWLGVSLRGRDRPASDSLLGDLAARPGYSFYRAAARDTLARRGWRDRVSGPDSAEVARESLRWDSAWGLADDELRELGLRLAATRPSAPQWLAAAGRAFRLGRTAQGTRWAERAFAAAADDSVENFTWSVVPWAYPPAFEPEVVAAESLGIERALLWALIRQESRFDPRARSVSDALGLTQLKVATAGDAARWLREPTPTAATLFAPDTSIRLGARYLKRMLDRSDGVVAVALAAYNAGPSTIRKDWRELVARGGEALYAEFASNADSQDYVKRILGFRQAYRELRPTVGP